jgi:hypothetical protein
VNTEPAPIVASPSTTGPSPTTVASREEEPAKNAIFLEALGSGLLYSVNYERVLPELSVGLRAGASFITYKVSNAEGSGNLVLATLPMLVNYYLGTPRHKVQLGLGATVMYFSASSDSTGTKFEGAGVGLGLAASGVIGYRYVPATRGVTLGAGFTPLLRSPKGLLLWGGASVGYAF